MLKIILFLLMTSSLGAQNASVDPEKPIPPVGMSQEYSSTTQTIKVALNSFKDWIIEAIENNKNEFQEVIFPCEYVKLYDQGKITKQQLIEAETKMARAWSEGSILQIVGEIHIENFYKSLYRYFESAPDLYGSDYHLQFLMLYPHE